MTLRLYTVFHLNIAYSSIDEDRWPDVIDHCYRPLLAMARDMDLPFGIEASVYTLEAAQATDPRWFEDFRAMVSEGPCEFIGSG